MLVDFPSCFLTPEFGFPLDGDIRTVFGAGRLELGMQIGHEQELQTWRRCEILSLCQTLLT
jgi:hypothetical protein